jgi:quercetin dioxygenase-like cupin family protein
MVSDSIKQKSEGITMKLAGDPVRGIYIQNFQQSDWVSLVNEAGEGLPGIRGRPGVAAPTLEGKMLGADLIEMQPGSAFPLHTHAGSHILYITQGHGLVQIDGVEYHIQPEDTIFIPAECPHHVVVPEGAGAALVFLALGHPHRPLEARDRMHQVE